MSLRRGRTVTAGFFAEFQQFLLRGNVVELAVAVVVGGAFGKIVESLIGDIVTPLILQPALSAAKVDDLARLSAGGLLYGKFLAAVLNFLVISFVIFVVIKLIDRLKQREEDQAAEVAAVDPQARLVEVLEKLEAKI